MDEALEIQFDTDTVDLWEEWAQPKLEAVSYKLEHVRLRFPRVSFSLTAAEELFLTVTKQAAEELKVKIHKEWQRLLARADSESAKLNVPAIPTCFELI